MLRIGLFLFAWPPMKDVHWIVPVLTGIPFWLGMSVDLYFGHNLLRRCLYGNQLRTSSAANGILRYGLGAVFPLFTLQM